jgi:Uma2 family endonuclease
MLLANVKSRMTPEEFEQLCDDGLFELVDGQLRGKQMGSAATETAAIVSSELLVFLRPTRMGRVFSEQSYRCFPHDPSMVRRPDISVICNREVPPSGVLAFAPDLVVEVISPNDLAEDVERKLGDYLRAGVRSVWLVSPECRSITVHHAGGTAVRFEGDAEVVDQVVLPGFVMPVSKLLAPPTPTPTPPKNTQ